MTTGALSFREREPVPARLLRFGLVLGLHVALVAWALRAQGDAPPAPVPARLEVLTVALRAPVAPAPRQAPQPVAPQPEPRVPPQQAQRLQQPSPQAAAPSVAASAMPVPQPVQAAAAQAASLAPPAPPAAAEAAAPAPAPVTAARFDADYLQNPAPVYPPLSRRAGEEGKVLLLVQVSAQGEAEDVHIRQSSGFARLDQAALNAVRKWRFVPARRGAEAVAGSVVVPLVFRLDSQTWQ